jgi:hypothetical protein
VHYGASCRNSIDAYIQEAADAATQYEEKDKDGYSGHVNPICAKINFG